MNKEEKAYCDTLLENNDFVKLVTFEVMLEIRKMNAMDKPKPARHSCIMCEHIFWNEFESQNDCRLGYLGHTTWEDIYEENNCSDYQLSADVKTQEE